MTTPSSQPLLQPPVPTHLLTKVMGRPIPDKTLHEMDDVTPIATGVPPVLSAFVFLVTLLPSSDSEDTKVVKKHCTGNDEDTSSYDKVVHQDDYSADYDTGECDEFLLLSPEKLKLLHKDLDHPEGFRPRPTPFKCPRRIDEKNR
ncbi:hypothetical protein SARC_07516 [Sphaeroforma arctica JP610]|uniref:Uncharacterized protein n=1 Tax=Sphaeroforma arctica JP610 TaxID=667725 RepID=A0A0L0FU96_9EUKA|nr:hypothetical protein SARC_07516 [Sphaeroforma arctica JP610]KNC80116.1 hypothetical protein SARC_07516 [Sphaeroforma arctica JP610]|eukprot:XP_014154018.1 hypothetical protein SARC_07516 [Sphaeroforma arctica JP610]